jgi:hypothetical protein
MPNVSPIKYTTTLHMRCDEEFLEKLDDLRANVRPVLTRAELIRELVEKAWAAQSKKRR